MGGSVQNSLMLSFFWVLLEVMSAQELSLDHGEMAVCFRLELLMGLHHEFSSVQLLNCWNFVF